MVNIRRWRFIWTRRGVAFVVATALIASPMTITQNVAIIDAWLPSVGIPAILWTEELVTAISAAEVALFGSGVILLWSACCWPGRGEKRGRSAPAQAGGL